MSKSILTDAIVKEQFEIELINGTSHTFKIGDSLKLVGKEVAEGSIVVTLPLYPSIALTLPQERFSLCSERMSSTVLERMNKLREKQEKKEQQLADKEAKIKEKELNKGHRHYVKNKKFYNMDVSEFSDKLNWLMDTEGITKEDIQNSLKVDFIKQSFWLTGKSFPDVETRQKLGELFGVSESFLRESSGSNKAIRITRSIRGTSDWYFNFIGEEFEFVSESKDGAIVISDTKENGSLHADLVTKGDYIVVFKQVLLTR